MSMFVMHNIVYESNQGNDRLEINFSPRFSTFMPAIYLFFFMIDDVIYILHGLYDYYFHYPRTREDRMAK